MKWLFDKNQRYLKWFAFTMLLRGRVIGIQGFEPSDKKYHGKTFEIVAPKKA